MEYHIQGERVSKKPMATAEMVRNKNKIVFRPTGVVLVPEDHKKLKDLVEEYNKGM